MTKEEIKLNPCPLCGKEPYIANWIDTDMQLMSEITQIRCDCGFSSPEYYGKNKKKFVTKIWNAKIKWQKKK